MSSLRVTPDNFASPRRITIASISSGLLPLGMQCSPSTLNHPVYVRCCRRISIRPPLDHTLLMSSGEPESGKPPETRRSVPSFCSVLQVPPISHNSSGAPLQGY